MNIVKCQLCGSTLNAEQAAKYERQRDAEKKALIKQAEDTFARVVTKAALRIRGTCNG